MVSLFDEVITIVNSLYDIEDIEFTVSYLGNIKMDISNDNGTSAAFRFEEYVTDDTSDLSDAELANIAIEYIERNSEKIKICFDYDKTNLISIFNVSDTRTYLEIENNSITYRLPTRLNAESFEAQLQKQFSEYELAMTTYDKRKLS